MKRSIKNIIEYSVMATDGPKGKVKDFLFDHDQWMIRYMEASFGKLFNNRKVLIPRFFLNDPDWKNKQFNVGISKKKIESCPVPEDRMPVSKKYEEDILKYYGIRHYWESGLDTPIGGALFFPPRPINTPVSFIDENDLDTNLRSFNEVEGYHIRTTDGRLGHVEDLIFDELDWQIVYMIVDTSNWRPWSKKVILAINWLDEIRYTDREIVLNLHSETIKEAPEYNPSHPIEMDYERALYEFYEQTFAKKI